jgi:hypothetical protein
MKKVGEQSGTGPQVRLQAALVRAYGPPGVIEQRCRVRPEVGDPLHGGRNVGDRLAADQRRGGHTRHPAFPIRTVALGQRWN